MIEGRELIFLLDKDRFFANKRVRMKIYPKDKKDKKGKKGKKGKQKKIKDKSRKNKK